jgi:drug/metabolite transporter (DMT)-like permease
MNERTIKTATAWAGKSWIWLAVFSLVAFGANSILCRLALKQEGIEPEVFTAIRLASGCLALLWPLRRKLPVARVGGSWKGGLALYLYAYLFSVAYVHLETGPGALVLFGSVQITMFLCSWAGGEKLKPRVMLGMPIAFAGLVMLLLPGASAPPLGSTLVMVVSGAAWGAYSLLGKASSTPLADTAGNFLRSLVFLPLLLLIIALHGVPHLSVAGVLYALGSGVVASGAGYAAWYSVVRHLAGQQAATLQLCVPIIASAGGVLLLSEPMTLRLVIASAVVLGGIAVALLPSRNKASPTK